jgi:hypothetical protein
MRDNHHQPQKPECFLDFYSAKQVAYRIAVDKEKKAYGWSLASRNDVLNGCVAGHLRML